MSADESSSRAMGRWRRTLATLPAVASALLPKVACPGCWPAYAGVLSALGLGFLMNDAWLLPLTSAFLILALGALGYRAGSRRGYGPLALGAIAATCVLLGRFALASEAVTYGGALALVGASLWNSWPRRIETACPECDEATPNQGTRL